MTCNLCGGDCNFLGTLGNLDHFRCTHCGMDFSQKIPADMPHYPEADYDFGTEVE